MYAMIIFLRIHNCLVIVLLGWGIFIWFLVTYDFFLYSQLASVKTIIVKSMQNKAGERLIYFQNWTSLLYYSEKCVCSQMYWFCVIFFMMVSNSIKLPSLLWIYKKYFFPNDRTKNSKNSTPVLLFFYLSY